MRELLRWLLGLAEKGSESSSDVARQRMRLVLIQDRIDLSPDKMEQMKREIGRSSPATWSSTTTSGNSRSAVSMSS